MRYHDITYCIAGYFCGWKFHEKLEEASRIKFRGFKVTINYFEPCEMHTSTSCLRKQLNLEHTERILLSTPEKDGMLQCRVLRERRVSQARPNQPQH